MLDWQATPGDIYGGCKTLSKASLRKTQSIAQKREKKARLLFPDQESES